MLFSSVLFLYVFLPLVLFTYYALPGKARNYLLLAASLAFYAWGEPKCVILMMGMIAANYVFALLIETQEHRASLRKVALFAAVAVNVLVLIIFKYLSFLVVNANAFFGTALRDPQIRLPIGISFFTFQGISYLIDVYRKDAPAQKNPFHVGLYISFFPQLIAGPIVRYETVAQEITSRRENWEDFTYGVRRFVIGLGKKVLLANQMAILADRCFDGFYYPEMTTLMMWMGAIAYALQIFFDFSGYSDMAIGLGRMFGFHFLENFNHPYLSGTITEFWRRWHISLSSWFRDYIYFPMGGSRVSKARNVFNLFVVWSLTGIWHGAGWNYLAWGWLFFVVLVAEKLLGIPKRKFGFAAGMLYRVFTLLVVLFGWVLFRSPNLPIAMAYLRKMAGIGTAGFTDPATIFVLKSFAFIMLTGILFSTDLPERVCGCLAAKGKGWELGTEIAQYVFLGIVFACCLMTLATTTYNPFIYFNF